MERRGKRLSYLERASQLNPGDYGTDYKLALAYVNAGQYERGRTQAQTLLARDRTQFSRRSRPNCIACLAKFTRNWDSLSMQFGSINGRRS